MCTIKTASKAGAFRDFFKVWDPLIKGGTTSGSVTARKAASSGSQVANIEARAVRKALREKKQEHTAGEQVRRLERLDELVRCCCD